ncbi:hypothetical protein COLO4_23408 [Corchorus olitorius]|uniref:Uncharacterized protein n=1 Tax=Corchorus olitorius TaxID=93759 RepID=A0A1R3IH49_9ROSI|nr:hypothetical protein COLO4_23408 [Corchorus olitorius]
MEALKVALGENNKAPAEADKLGRIKPEAEEQKAMTRE